LLTIDKLVYSASPPCTVLRKAVFRCCTRFLRDDLASLTLFHRFGLAVPAFLGNGDGSARIAACAALYKASNELG